MDTSTNKWHFYELKGSTTAASKRIYNSKTFDAAGELTDESLSESSYGSTHFQGIRALYCLTHLNWSLFRKGGVTPLAILDCAVYSPESGQLVRHGSMFVCMTHASDSVLSAICKLIAGLRPEIKGPGFGRIEISFPGKWENARAWTHTHPPQTLAAHSRDFEKVCNLTGIPSFTIESTSCTAPLDLFRDNRMQPAKFIHLTIHQESRRDVVSFRGMVCGSEKQSDRLIENFLLTILPALDV
jgi:hypothetical protein